jgi:hypothetical protein
LLMKLNLKRNVLVETTETTETSLTIDLVIDTNLFLLLRGKMV